MYMIAEVSQYVAVASFAEAWIEIVNSTTKKSAHFVASFAEAWIEILVLSMCLRFVPVASFAEAWIEILLTWGHALHLQSPPSRRRGLKYQSDNVVLPAFRRLLRGGVDWNLSSQTLHPEADLVASFAEAWIEIFKPVEHLCFFGRLLRGGVDWNLQCKELTKREGVASFAEAWIEILIN